MMETKTQIRLATTAIAAALAIAATPLLAQDAPPPDTSVESPVSTAPDPLAPGPTTDTSVATDTGVATESTVAPEVTQTTSEAAPARSTRATASRRAASAARAGTRPAPASADTAVTPAPAVAAGEALQAPPAAEAAPIAPAPPVAAEPSAARQMQMNAYLAIAVAGALVLLALVATALTLRRRRRRAAVAENAEWQVAGEAAVAEPVMVVEPETVPVLSTGPSFPAPAVAAAAEGPHEVEGPVAELPKGFDLSRFGFNVQEAYKGPTEDNPSLSMKHRLRRASGMDQQERKLDAEVEAATGEPVLVESDLKPPAEAPAGKPAVADPAPGDFLLAKPGKEPVKDPARTH